MQYDRICCAGDNGDLPYPIGKKASVIWAIGRLDDQVNPSFHRAYNKETFMIQFDRPDADNCQKTFVKYKQKIQYAKLY